MKKLGKSKKGSWQMWLLGLGGGAMIILVIMFGLSMLGITKFSGGKLSLTDDENSGKFDYTGKLVEVNLKAYNLYNSSAIDPTYYVYDVKPTNWNKPRVSVEDGYISAYTSTSGTAVLTEEPGTYYVRAIVSGYYDEFLEVVVPASGDVSLSQYNDGGEAIEKFQFVDVETLSVSNVDLGIATNESSDITYTAFGNFNVGDDEGFWLDEIKFREDSTYSFATDTNGTGTYDEGINKIKVTIGGTTFIPFDVSNSINQFAGDDEAILDLDKLYGQNEALTIKFEVTCDATLDTTTDADEKCGNGEDFLDDVIFVDKAGNTATFHLVG